jgi:hypothetical protein
MSYFLKHVVPLVLLIFASLRVVIVHLKNSAAILSGEVTGGLREERVHAPAPAHQR